MEETAANEQLLEALHNSEMKYRRLVERSFVLLLLLDADLSIRLACNSIEKVLHVAPAAIVGKNLFDALPIRQEAELSKAFSRLREQEPGATQTLELTIAMKGENLFFEGAVTNFLHDPAIRGFVLYLHNITDRKRAEEELLRLNFELDSFVYKASHDMRAPLLNLLGLIDIAQRDFPLQTPYYLDLMKRNVLRLDRFILDLTEYSRNDRTGVESVPIHLRNVIEECIESFQYLPNAAAIHFAVDVSVARPFRSDPVRLKIILNNLLSNAIKYHDMGKKAPLVQVKAWDDPERGQLVLEVRDNGIGIMENYLDRVFDMFFRASERSEGSGLGLYIVKKVVDKLNGRIELKTKFGEGTTFTIALPAGSEP
jgi:hypothetical protein